MPGAQRPRRAHGRSPAGFRSDIEGLRAVAVLAVLIFHAGMPFTPGGYVGVDVFFVISGFLITGLLVRDADRNGRIDLARFYAQRAKRLLPPLLLVLLAVVVMAFAVLPPVRTVAVAWDVIAAGTYVINWKLAISAVDYFAEGDLVSPLQHIWSLAVEEQFYLLWPALLIAAFWWQRRSRNPNGHRIPIIAMAAVTVVSFGYNLLRTHNEAGFAYFSSLTRAWELGVGGLLAMLLLVWRPGTRLALLLSTGGATAIVLAVLLLTEETMFPGLAALAPTLGAAAIIAAGAADRLPGPHRFLLLGPVRHLGKISYAWYLWHWPFVVFAGAIWGRLSVVEGVVAVAASYVPAVLSTYLVEDRVRHSARLAALPGRSLRLGLACTLVAVTAGIGLQLSAPTIDEAPSAKASGARVLPADSSVQKRVSEIRPSPAAAKDDRGRMHADGCLVGKKQTEIGNCVYGDRNGDTTVVLFGDSHAMQWFPALDKVARKNGWRILALTKSGCQPADVTSYAPSFSRAYTECDEWRADALQRISEAEPNLIVTSSLTTYTVMDGDTKLDPERSADELRKGYARTLKRLKEDGDKVVAIDDTPVQSKDVVDCVASHPENLERCAADEQQAAGGTTPFAQAAQQDVNEVNFVDPLPVLCPDDRCPAVIGNVLVYRDDKHLSATYAATLDKWLERELPKPS